MSFSQEENTQNEIENLDKLGKQELIEMIVKLKGEVSKQNEDFKKLTNLRLYNLERSQYMYEQYGRRESLEISGIPVTISNEKLEEEVIGIFEEAKVKVHGKSLGTMDITAVHRLADKKDYDCTRREPQVCKDSPGVW